MKIFCDREVLLTAATNVQRAVSGKSALPVLDGVLLRTVGSQVMIAGYDLELGIVTYIDARVKEPGQIVLNARLFGDIVRKLSGETVEISTDDRFQTSIRTETSEFTVLGIDATEYPELPTVVDGERISLSEVVLKSMIRQTIYAVAQTDIRPVHTGIQFIAANHKLRLVAVDGARLAVRCEEIDSDLNIKFVVPGKTLAEMIKLLGDTENPATLSVGKQHILTEINGYTVISRLLEGEFFDYEKTVPSQVTTQVRVNTRLLTEGVERTSLVISDRLKSPLVCYFSEENIVLSCRTALGSATDKVKIEKMDGRSIKIGFNSRFLLEALKNAETDEALIQLIEPTMPMKIYPVEGESFFFMILPVRMKENI